MILNDLFELDTIQKISLLDLDATVEWLEFLWRPNECRDVMTSLCSLPNNLQTCTTRGP